MKVGADVLALIILKYMDVLMTGSTQFLYLSTFIKYSYFPGLVSFNLVETVPGFNRL